MAQFVVNSTSVEIIISSIKEGEIAIPEIQRPFVWDGTKGNVSHLYLLDESAQS